MKTILITGAGTGIGRALSELILKDDQKTKIIAVGRRTKPLESLKTAFDTQVTIIQADIGTEIGRAKIVAYVHEHSIKLTHVVHNAGVALPISTIKNLKLEEYRASHAINTEAPLFLTKDLIPLAAPSCRFLFISSGAAYGPFIGLPTYCISKAALEMVCSVFQEEYKDDNVFFASLRPGGVNTPMAQLLSEVSSDILPIAPRVQERIRDKSLLAPETSARFIKWVLFDTEASKYQQHWNINDPQVKK